MRPDMLQQHMSLHALQAEQYPGQTALICGTHAEPQYRCESLVGVSIPAAPVHTAAAASAISRRTVVAQAHRTSGCAATQSNRRTQAQVQAIEARDRLIVRDTLPPDLLRSVEERNDQRRRGAP